MFPKISSTNRRSAWPIREMDLLRLARSSRVFMRGIRRLRQNLSENFGENSPALQRWAHGVLCGESQRDERNVLPSLPGLASNCAPNPAFKRWAIAERHRRRWNLRESF